MKNRKTADYKHRGVERHDRFWPAVIIVYFLSLTGITFYVLTDIWNLPTSSFLGQIFKPGPESIYDTKLIIIAISFGILGACVHGVASISIWRNRPHFEMDQIVWYLTRPPLGAALAVIAYLFIRAGLIEGSASSLNSFGIACITSLIGFFTTEIMNRLRDIFDTLFGISPTIGVEGEKIERASFTDASKIEEKFELLVSNAQIDDELRRQLQENKAFLTWCSKTKKDPNQTISQISGEALNFMQGYVKTYYAHAFLENLKNASNQVGNIDTKKCDNTVPYVKFDVSFDLPPVETYMGLSKGFEIAISRIYQKANLYEAKLTLKIDTNVQVKKMELFPTQEGTKIFLENVKANLKLSFPTLILSNRGKPISLTEKLLSADFEVDELYIFNAQRVANVWIRHHQPNKSLIIGEHYDLMVNVGMKGSDDILPDSVFGITSNEYSGAEVTVSISGEAFEIQTNTKSLFLPKKGDSKPIAFEIQPKISGSHELELSFYYKLNLLLILSVRLQVEFPVPARIKGDNFLTTEIVVSSDKAFESIFEIERSVND